MTNRDIRPEVKRRTIVAPDPTPEEQVKMDAVMRVLEDPNIDQEQALNQIAKILGSKNPVPPKLRPKDSAERRARGLS